MRIIEYLRPAAVIANLSGSTAHDVLAELCQPLAATGFHPNDLLAALLDRERLSSTGIGDGVAIPHCKVHGLSALTLGFGRSQVGIDFSALDGQPTFLFFTLFSPEQPGSKHLSALARISQILGSATFRNSVRKASDAATIYSLIEAEDTKHEGKP
jgi:PTS system nitrogen regulatory IIA component